MRRSAILLMGLGACATLADNGGGDENLPNAVAGPFREIFTEELSESRTAPYALRSDDVFYRDVAVVDADEAPARWVFAARSRFAEDVEPDPAALPTEIVRFEAVDGWTPARQEVPILVAEAPWEGGTVGQPAALRVEDDLLLFYAGAAGIGLADGSGARSGGAPVLEAATDGWDAGAIPHSPGVVLLQDGLHLFYEVTVDGASVIGEALSTDGGGTFSRVGAGPVLAPLPGSLDGAGVRAPMPVAAQTAVGREVLYLYYGALDEEGKATIALAARYPGGPFERAASPVFGISGSLGPTEPWVLRVEGVSLLYATQLAGTTSAQQYPAVALAVAPADLRLAPEP